MSAPMDRLYRFAWKNVRRLPGPVGYGVFHLGADLVWLAHRLRPRPTGAGQLRRNLARLLPAATSDRQLNAAVRAGMRSYMRYFYEVFALPAMTPEQIRARVRADIDPSLVEALGRGSVVVALAHMGNWDLAGAWACRHLAPVLTVAERLEPVDLFEQFVEFREGLGMRVIGQSHGERVFDSLVETAGAGRYVIALLADRDLSASGVMVDVEGHPARVAAGPAALADRLGLPLFIGVISYETLTGSRRRAAGSRWGLVLTLSAVPEPADTALKGRERIVAWTRAWVERITPHLRSHAVDWHMLQAVFDEDLDQARLARSHRGQQEQRADAGAQAGGSGAPARVSASERVEGRLEAVESGPGEALCE